MKRKLLLAALCVVSALGFKANAQGTWTAPVIPGSDISSTNTGNYAIYNVKADAFMGEGMNYNTEAIACRLEGGYSAALAARQKFTLSVSNGTVKMVHANHTDRGVGCASTNANDIYADYASNNQWAYASSNTAPDYGNVYNLSLAGFGTLDVDDKWGGKLTTKSGKGFTDWAFIPESSLIDGSFAKWVERKAMYDIYLALVASSSTSTYASELADANGVYVNSDATVSELRAATRALILATAAGIQQSTNVSALFTNANMQQDGTSDWTNDDPLRSGGAIERWHGTFTLTQSKTDIPNGMYTLVFRGMTRQDGSGAAPIFSATTSGEVSNNANIPWMTDIASRWSVRGTGEWAGDDNNKIPNKLWRAAEGLAYDEATATISNFKVTGNALTLTVTQNRNDQWFTYNSFDIIYNGPANLVLYNQLLAAKATAEAIDDAETTDAVQDALDAAIAGTAGLSPSSAEDDLNAALYALNTAIGYYEDTKDSYASYNDLKASADGIAAVGYTETTSGSHDTFTSAISTQTSAVEGATAASTITTATSTLKAAIKTYINGAEPENEGEYFDITCLMVNPNFDDSHNGWTYLSAPGVNWSNCEYYQAEFDINQTVTGLPTGSYSLSVQAFQRPGWAGAVYDAYIGGTDNASSVLYINSITSKVKNIAADAQASPLLDKEGDKNYGDWPYDSQVGTEGNYKYVPNSQQGAKQYFDAGLYDATCAAVVTEGDGGSLKLGFKSTKPHVEGDWTIFDNFRLYYYGSSLLVYYQQYWPQLKAEVEEDLANAAYVNVLVSSEDEAVDAALAATPSTGSEYETAIDNLTTARDNFRAAKPSYDAMVAAQEASKLTKISANIGTGVFQYNETTNNTLYSAYEPTKDNVDNYEFTTSSTAAGAQALVDALNTATDNYNNQPLNAPDADTRYVLTLAGKGALSFKTASTEGGYGMPFMTANVNLAQAFMFEAVSGNTYKMYFYDFDGNKRYICTRADYGEGGTGTYGIRTATDKSLNILIEATATADVFNMLNTACENRKLGSTGGDFYTDDAYTNWTIAETSQATVPVAAKAGKYGTIIFPFTPDVSSGFDNITFYSCNSVNGGESVEITEIVGDPVANTPYIIKNTSASDDFTKNVSGWGTAAALSYPDAENLLTGIYTAATIPANSYVLQTQDDVQKFYKLDVDATGVAYRAYLTTPSSAKVLRVVDGTASEVTAPEVVETEEPEVLYNMAGIQVDKNFKGVVVNQKGVKRFNR